MSQAIERLKEMPREMTSEQAGHVLDRSRHFISRAIVSQKLEHRGDTGRGNGDNPRYFISQEALLAFIVRSTGGDRMTLMHAIKELLPKRLHDLALKVAAETTDAPKPPSWLQASQKARTARAARVQPDPFADHPDFFRTPSAAD